MQLLGFLGFLESFLSCTPVKFERTVAWLSADSNKDTKNMGDAAAVIRYYCYCCAPSPPRRRGREEGGKEEEWPPSGLRLTHGTLQKLAARAASFPLAQLPRSALLQKLSKESLKPMGGQNRREAVRKFMNRFIGFDWLQCGLNHSETNGVCSAVAPSLM